MAWLLVLGVAGFLRFQGITTVGIRFEDEAWYASDARLWHRCARVLTDAAALQAIGRHDKKAFQRRMDELGVDFQARYLKPCQGYTFLGALMMFLAGDRPAALLVTNAVCGTLSVMVLYSLVAALWSRRVALLAAGLLAVSPYHLVYCRSALADTSAGLFILWGTLAWVYGWQGRWLARRAYFWSGIALGYAVTCHSRAAFVPFTLMIVDGWLRLRRYRPVKPGELLEPFDKPSRLFSPSQAVERSGPPVPAAPGRGEDSLAPDKESVPVASFVRRRHDEENHPRGTSMAACSFWRAWLWWGIGVVLPTAMLESVFRMARLAAQITDSFLPVRTFLEAHWYWGKRTSQVLDVGWNSRVLTTYAAHFSHWQGVTATALAAVGLLFLVRARGPARAFPWLLIVLGLALSFQQCLVARALAMVLPFLCVGLAIVMSRLVEGISRPSRRLGVVAALLLAGVVFGPAIVRAGKVCDRKSQLAQGCAWLARRGGTVFVPSRCKYWLYLERSGVNVLDGERCWRQATPAETLQDLREKGVRWVLLGPQYWHYRDGGLSEPIFRWWQTMQNELSRHAELVAEFPHLRTSRWEFLVEGPGPAPLAQMVREDGGPLRVYDLRTFQDESDSPATMAAVVSPKP